MINYVEVETEGSGTGFRELAMYGENWRDIYPGKNRDKQQNLEKLSQIKSESYGPENLTMKGSD